jgi:hypothetical protein
MLLKMADEKIIQSAPQTPQVHESKGTNIDDPEIATAAHVEVDDDLKKDHMDYGRVDKEVAKYASAVAILIFP